MFFLFITNKLLDLLFFIIVSSLFNRINAYGYDNVKISAKFFLFSKSILGFLVFFWIWIIVFIMLIIILLIKK